MSRCSFGVEFAEAALEPLLALVGALLQPRDLRAALADLGLGFIATACRLLLGGEQHRLRFLFDGAYLLETALGIRIVRDAAFRHGFARVPKCCNRKCGRNNH